MKKINGYTNMYVTDVDVQTNMQVSDNFLWEKCTLLCCGVHGTKNL